jgi:outer membrane protein assembly factor BamE (lipoprotein component of BamABCDE complex)
MRYSAHKSRIGIIELTFLLLGLILLLVLATVANGQSPNPTKQTVRAHPQIQQPLYREYRGVRLGMTAVEVRAKLGEPVLKSNEQDYFVISSNETAQIAYDTFQKVLTISTDYTGGVGAPDYKAVVGEGMLLQRPDGSLFSMVQYKSEGMWVSYHKSAATVPVVTITMQLIK